MAGPGFKVIRALFYRNTVNHLVKSCIGLQISQYDPCKGLLRSNILPVFFFSSSSTALEYQKISHRDKSNQIDLIANEIDGLESISLEIVDLIRRKVLPSGYHVNKSNFETIFLEVCRLRNSFSIGRSFFLLLYSENKCNLATIGKFFRICYDFSADCTKEDKDFLIKLYRDILSKYDVLDSRTCESLLLGLSITDRWQDGFKLLDMCRLSSAPSTKMFSALAVAAFSNNEHDLALKLVNEMAMIGLSLLPEIYEAWLDFTGITNALPEILNFIEKYNLDLTEEVAEMLIKFSRNLSSFSGAFSTITSKGVCKNCQLKLKPVTLSDEEFSKLRSTFLDPVLIGKDIFLKTKPSELKSFLSFLEETGKVDVVLDGLNIAYSRECRRTNNIASSQTLCYVIQHFKKQSRKVAVIGRKHMESWPKQNWNYIKNNSSLFLADNVSADDPFLLYTALQSGRGTIFVSRDQMRSHKFLLKGPELDKTFSRWQQIHQYYLQHVSASGEVTLVRPMPYLRGPQESDGKMWHIPIVTPLDGVPGHLVAQKTKWLCLPYSLKNSTTRGQTRMREKSVS